MTLYIKQQLLIFLISFAIFCNGQSSEIQIDYDFFLLGTLNDYMGRETYRKIDNRVDAYYQNSKTIVSFLDSVLRDKYPDITISTNEKTGSIELQSKLLAQRLNDFYSYKPSGRLAYSGEADVTALNLDSLTKTPGFYSTYFDTIYTGRMKEDIFKNDSERFSFLAGAYMRFGGENDSHCYINVPNSISKIKVATVQLNELGCRDVEYVVKKDYIPVGHTVYFTPTDELRKYFEAIHKSLLIAK